MMQEHNLTWQEKNDASKLEKDLIQRMEDLNMDIQTTDKKVQQLMTSIGTTGVSPYLSGGQTTVIDKLTDTSNKIDRALLEIKILHLKAAEIIDVAEFRRLLTLINSVDEENHVIALELIENKMKEI